MAINDASPLYVTTLLKLLNFFSTCAYISAPLRTASKQADSKRFTGVMIAGIVLASTPLVAKDWITWLRSDFGTKTSWLASFATSDFRAAESDALATYFREQTRADETVFIWGFEPDVYMLCERRCPTRFIYNLPEGQAVRDSSRSVIALSPDGRQFVYSTESGDGLYLRTMSQLEARLIPGTGPAPRSPTKPTA